MLKLCQEPVYCFQCCFLLAIGEWDVALFSFSSTQVAIQARSKPWATHRNGGLLLSARISQPAFNGTSPYLWKRPPYCHIRTEITILLETPPFLGSTERKEHVVTGHFTLLFFAEFLSKFIPSIFILVTWISTRWKNLQCHLAHIAGFCAATHMPAKILRMSDFTRPDTHCSQEWKYCA